MGPPYLRSVLSLLYANINRKLVEHLCAKYGQLASHYPIMHTYLLSRYLSTLFGGSYIINFLVDHKLPFTLAFISEHATQYL